MTRRRILGMSVAVLAVIGVAVTSFSLVASLAPSQKARALAGAPTVSIADLVATEPGAVRFVEAYGRPILIFRPSEATWRGLKMLDAHVWNPKIAGYSEEFNVFIFWGFSTKLGCNLKHFPPGVVWDQERPNWNGGYFDPCGDPSYDYAGRTIKDVRYTVNGYAAEHPNLRPVHFEGPYGDQISIYPWW